MQTLKLVFLSLATLLLTSSLAQAENSTRTDGYTIHHNAFLSTELAPDMASRYNIRRSPNRAVINISIIRNVPGTTGKPVTAKVKVVSHNLRGQVRNIPVREIKEQNAVYYIGEFLVENQESVTFTIEAIPSGENKPLQASLKQQFFTR
ncbi:DUF4426 domain-containing protein [Thiolapillus brandeum]|uniref:DUF4426 domain-containing protein n=1 Tax=Thiolapillus brandeum TaxID=1076588 RepID=A0A7U6GKX9_9GAMM|nr:DUF4426 domain-containing protein [Thiolapillus brandeum]BAO45515.1 conserved hypothetical protein [Thiolapillus brandeum]